MAKKQPEKKKPSNHVLIGLLLVLGGLVATGGMIGAAGVGGLLFAQGSFFLFGAGSIIVPISLLTAGVLTLIKKTIALSARQAVAGSIALLSLLGLIASYSQPYGGLAGRLFRLPLVALFDGAFAALILAFLAFGALILFFDHTPVIFPHLKRLWLWLKSGWEKKEDPLTTLSPDLDDEDAALPLPLSAAEQLAANPKKKEAAAHTNTEEDFIITPKRKITGSYVPPPLSLLEKDRGKADVGDVKANANIIRRTLLNFGIEVEMDEITIGPTVTRYALKPAEGVKLSRIVGLQSDLALALAAHPLRIEAPIPGKSLVGIEIPNKSKATVGLASLLADPLFQSAKPLLVAVGRNIAGKSVFKSIAKMPHLLIAGTTGSGKSVTIHALITSLLYRHGPDELRLIFVDPKRVELTLYNAIPHLLTPVITDAKKAILSLKWAATEMNRRYDILERESVRDIESYHQKVASGKIQGRDGNEPDKMPFIVIVMDELADIMQAYPRELEAAIVRLAQMSRAVGIHLVLSTQRPEVNVITGLIKANVPSRIALRVPTLIDSRTILDASGAEKLLGHGDMLALIETNQAERVQSAFISEDEVKSVVHYLKDTYAGDDLSTIELAGTVSSEKSMFSDSLEEGEDDDALYEEARIIVIEAGKASTSYIQRKLKVGYARAARLMDMLEERGVIGAADGAKPRDVLVSPGSSAHVPTEETIL